MTPLMHRDTMEPYDLREIGHIDGVDHNESISVGPHGEAYTTGFYTFRVFRLNLDTNTGEAFASTAPRCVLGQVVDAQSRQPVPRATILGIYRSTQNRSSWQSAQSQSLYANHPGPAFLANCLRASQAIRGALRLSIARVTLLRTIFRRLRPCQTRSF